MEGPNKVGWDDNPPAHTLLSSPPNLRVQRLYSILPPRYISYHIGSPIWHIPILLIPVYIHTHAASYHLLHFYRISLAFLLFQSRPLYSLYPLAEHNPLIPSTYTAKFKTSRFASNANFYITTWTSLSWSSYDARCVSPVTSITLPKKSSNYYPATVVI